jgi:hypothetical protein
MVSRTPDEARAANTPKPGTTSGAYSAPVNPWASVGGMSTEYNNYINFLGSQDTLGKQNAFNKIMEYWRSTPSPTGQGGYDSYIQQLLRTSGYSKGKTGIGVFSSEDADGLSKALADSIRNGADFSNWLGYISKNGGVGGGNGKKQPDTTPKYSKQISTALKMKDYGDAQNYLYDAYFNAFGVAPSKDIVSKFKDGWNAELKKQEKPTVTAMKTTFKPVIDKKTGKQARDRDGILQYETINKTETLSEGQGFTEDEQQQFLATYLSTNYPDAGFDPATIGGAAKTIHDDIVATYKNNYQAAPDLKTIAPIIQQVIGTADANTAKTILDKAKSDIRGIAATKYMGIADQIKAGEDANKYIEPMIKTVSEFLETPVTIDDDFMKMALNYQGPDKTYRQMNDYELSQALVKDARYGRTSKAKNEALNLAQAISSKLG